MQRPRLCQEMGVCSTHTSAEENGKQDNTSADIGRRSRSASHSSRRITKCAKLSQEIRSQPNTESWASAYGQRREQRTAQPAGLRGLLHINPLYLHTADPCCNMTQFSGEQGESYTELLRNLNPRPPKAACQMPPLLAQCCTSPCSSHLSMFQLSTLL